MKEHTHQIIVFLAFVSLTLGLTYLNVYGTDTRTSDDACGACHSNYHVYVTVTGHDMPAQVTVGSGGTLHVDVEITGYGGTGPKSKVDLTVSVFASPNIISFQNSPQVVNGVSSPYTNTFSFPYTPQSEGSTTVTIKAEIKPHKGTTVSDSVYPAVQVTSGNSPPTLSGGSVSPSSGSESDTFVYTVTYTDADGDTPTYIRVYIDSTPYNMYVSDGLADTITTGEVYEYTATGTDLGIGSHTYRFEASDGTDMAVGDTAEKSGPVVTSGPNSPPELNQAGFDPDKGYTGWQFNFSVIYSDADGDPPAPYYPKLYIEDTNHTIILSQVMASTGGSDYATGVKYTTTIYIDHTGPTYYYITASDGEIEVRTDTLPGPELMPRPENHAPTILSTYPGVVEMQAYAPYSGVFSVNATDPDGDNLTYEWYLDGEPMDASTPLLRLNLSGPGGHEISVRVSDVPAVGSRLTVDHVWSLDLVAMPHLYDYYNHGSNVSVEVGNALAFLVALDSQALGDVVAVWFMDGVEVGSGLSYTLDTHSLPTGLHILEVEAHDELGFHDSIQWNVSIYDLGGGGGNGGGSGGGDEGNGENSGGGDNGALLQVDRSQIDDSVAVINTESNTSAGIILSLWLVVVLLALAYVIRWILKSP